MNDQLIGDIGYNGKTFSQVLELECCEFLLDKFLFQNVENWLQEEWPFRRRAYPGRTISWEDWK